MLVNKFSWFLRGKSWRFEHYRSKGSMSVNKFADFNGKSDKGKTPLTVPRCADNRQLFEGTVGKEVNYDICNI